MSASISDYGMHYAIRCETCNKDLPITPGVDKTDVTISDAFITADRHQKSNCTTIYDVASPGGQK